MIYNLCVSGRFLFVFRACFIRVSGRILFVFLDTCPICFLGTCSICVSRCVLVVFWAYLSGCVLFASVTHLFENNEMRFALNIAVMFALEPVTCAYLSVSISVSVQSSFLQNFVKLNHTLLMYNLLWLCNL